MMKITDRAYGNRDEEDHELCEFLNLLATIDPFVLWDSGRMSSWRYDLHANKHPQDQFFRDNAHFWRTDDQGIVGLCISEYGRNDMFIEVLPAYHGIYPDMFRWIETTWAASRATIEIETFRDDTQKIQRLETQGFSFLCHFANKWTYDLEQIDLGYTLEEGFTIQPFSDSLDFAGRVTLVQSAFNNPRYTEKNLKGLTASPDYRDAYHMLVVSPDEQYVAYCVGWPDQTAAHSGYIEPVGTHAAFRQRGFAKAIIKECFTRMKANGINTVYIASMAEPDVSNYLYTSLSPQSKREVHKYAKTVS